MASATTALAPGAGLVALGAVAVAAGAGALGMGSIPGALGLHGSTQPRGAVQGAAASGGAYRPVAKAGTRKDSRSTAPPAVERLRRIDTRVRAHVPARTPAGGLLPGGRRSRPSPVTLPPAPVPRPPAVTGSPGLYDTGHQEGGGAPATTTPGTTTTPTSGGQPGGGTTTTTPSTGAGSGSHGSGHGNGNGNTTTTGGGSTTTGPSDGSSGG